MAVQWTGSGPDVMLQLDRAADESLGSQMQRALRDAIRQGRVANGERLPSSRILARDLGVSRGLVVDCYSQLRCEGFLAAGPAPRPPWRSAPSISRRLCGRHGRSAPSGSTSPTESLISTASP